MITPRTLSQMITASRLETARKAIIDTLDPLLVGVTVVGHPGKLDINDVVAKTVVAAPGVAIGWTRVRSETQVGGQFNAPVEWAAYIVAEDFADLAEKRSVTRDAVAHGIGQMILEILADPDLSSWGLNDINRPEPDPGPSLVPMFTAKSWEAGTAYYAVTWRQAFWDSGASFFDASTVAIRESQEPGITAEAEFDEPGIPTEIMAMMRQADEGSSS